jgi:hypothetical protein
VLFLPEILLRVADSVWPTSRGLPVGTGRCDSLALDRELVAGSLPGQVRGKTGFSVGTASVTIPQPRDAQFTPWSPSTGRLIDAGAEAELIAWDEVAKTETPLGRWRVAKPAGALTSSQMDVELDESQARGRSLPNRLPTTDAPVDPVWIVDQLARRMGFWSTPAPVPSATLSLPLVGSLAAEVGTTPTSTVTPIWSGVTGAPGLASAAGIIGRLGWDTTRTTYLTANIAGAVVFRLGGVDLRIADGEVALRTAPSGSWSARAFVRGLSPAWTTRVQVELWTDGVVTNARARSAADAAWSDWAITSSGEPTDQFMIMSLAGGLSGLQVSTFADPALWAPRSARMSLLGGTVPAPWVPATDDTWTALQGVCDSWAAIAVKTNDERLVVLNRGEAAGAGRPKTRIDVDRMAEDIKWDVAADDYADRLVVTWHPVTWPDEFTGPSEWTVAEALHVPAGTSVAVDVDLGGYVRELMPWVTYSDGTGELSEWEANTAADGSGVSVESGLTVTTSHPSPARARVSVFNASAADVWMVDADGASGLILRGVGQATQDAPSTIMRGKIEADAKFPLDIDLGKTVQTRADADELASYLWERVNRARFRADSVRLPLDWTRDLGDILILEHARSGLRMNALVVGIHIDTGTAGMTVDLVALPTTWDDFDAVWASKTFDQFDAVWADKTLTAFDSSPLTTEA